MLFEHDIRRRLAPPARPAEAARQYPDDGDHHQQFHQGKAIAANMRRISKIRPECADRTHARPARHDFNRTARESTYATTGGPRICGEEQGDGARIGTEASPTDRPLRRPRRRSLLGRLADRADFRRERQSAQLLPGNSSVFATRGLLLMVAAGSRMLVGRGGLVAPAAWLPLMEDAGNRDGQHGWSAPESPPSSASLPASRSTSMDSPITSHDRLSREQLICQLNSPTPHRLAIGPQKPNLLVY